MRRKKRWGGLEVAGVICGVAIVAAILFPVNGHRPESPTSSCRFNLRRLAVGMEMYIADADERGPVGDWSISVGPYFRPSDATCPLVAKERQKYGYALNRDVAGINTAKVAHPDTTVVLFETDALGPGVIANLATRNEDRHDGKSNVAYLDTHSATIEKGETP